MEIWQIVFLAAVGVVAGWLNVMAGGGSLLTIPIMLFMGIPGPVANGTNRIAILAQNISAVTAFKRQGYADFKLGLSLSAAAAVGAVGGASLGLNLQGEWFDRMVALVMVGVMILMATGHDKVQNRDTSSQPKNLLWGHCADGRRRILGRIHSDRRRLHLDADPAPGYRTRPPLRAKESEAKAGSPRKG